MGGIGKTGGKENPVQPLPPFSPFRAQDWSAALYNATSLPHACSASSIL